MCILCALYFIMSGLTSCQCGSTQDPVLKADTLSIRFTLTCSEEFINFVTPTATYKDASGVEQNIEISKSSFILVSDNEGLVDQSEPALYSWTQEIVLPNTRTGQRDIKITYKKCSDAPVIDNEKTYIMYHKLSDGYTVKYKEGGTVTYIDGTIVILNGQDSHRKDVKGSELPEYLEEIANTSDYTKRAV